LQAGSGFLSQHTKNLLFGLGQAKGTINASIRWPSGLLQQFANVPVNHRVHIEEGSGFFHAEPFRPATAVSSEVQASEELPDCIETWLLWPVPAPVHSGLGKVTLLYLWASESDNNRDQVRLLQTHLGARGLHIETLDLSTSADDAAILNILISSLFDRHRDLTIPTSLLIDENGNVVKVYQGLLNIENVERDFRDIPKSDAARLAKALPFSGNTDTYEFGRNHLSLGSIYFQRGYFPQAEIWFKQALSENPSSAEAHYGLGSAQLKQGDRAAAQGSFEQAVKANADYPDTKPNAWNNLGLLATQADNLDAAIGFFKEALLLSPDHVISLLNLGNSYRQKRGWNEARQTLEHAAELQPDNAEVNYSLGMVFAQTDQSDVAYTYLKRAVELRPNYPEAMNNLGVLYLHTRQPDKAIAEFEACIRIAPEFDRAYLNLARVYVIEGNREKARQVLSALLGKHPDHSEARKALEEIH
jgi:Tfp pilus assembly protein PilF